MKLFSLPFTGLKIGKHQFEYEIDDAFFNEFEYSLVKKGLLYVDLVLEKQETMMVLDFQITGKMQLSCDRCLSDYPYIVDAKDRLIAKFSEEDLMESTEEVIVLSKNDSEIDISGFLYEMINLSVPYINVCDKPGETTSCDKDMLAKLAEFSTEKEEEQSNEDPRWEALKKIKNN